MRVLPEWGLGIGDWILGDSREQFSERLIPSPQSLVPKKVYKILQQRLPTKLLD
ncbi:MAG: hypothetical protein V7K67_19940 [Nostoc sp.]|uniref:hypothetical protein n=1 Tax=Nostoc sp. TaxID=1180 RepID=UPI002FFB7872